MKEAQIITVDTSDGIRITYKLPVELADLYKHILQKGYLEYRDPEHETLEDFKKWVKNNADVYAERFSKDYYMKRNENGTYLQALKLLDAGLIEYDTNAWHITFKPVYPTFNFERRLAVVNFV